jgi:outer membrane immunogenic protein
MNTQLKILGMAVLATLAATIASSAADLSPPPAYVPPATPIALYNWSGAYAGVEAGGTFGGAQDNYISGSSTAAFDVNGGLIGGTLGYNWQKAGWVWGLEGDLSATNASGSTICIVTTDTCSATSSWLGTARVRLGYAFGRLLPYLTGGYAVGNVAATVLVPGTGSNTENYTRSGYTFGGGLEYGFASHWSAKVEYLYVGLANHSYFLSSPAPTFAFPRNVPYDASVVRVGLNYRF